jgi:hypothetical protein
VCIFETNVKYEYIMTERLRNSRSVGSGAACWRHRVRARQMQKPHEAKYTKMSDTITQKLRETGGTSTTLDQSVG